MRITFSRVKSSPQRRRTYSSACATPCATQKESNTLAPTTTSRGMYMAVLPDIPSLQWLRRPSIRPWLCCLELRGQAKEPSLIAEWCDELYPHRQPRCRPVQRHRHCRIADGVE